MFEEVTKKQQATWATGDFGVIARKIMDVSSDLVRAVDPHSGQRVLDVACGSGNTALIAARRDCDVSGIDYVPELIAHAKERAQAEGTDIDFQVGDAQELPYPNEHFDHVFSVFGVMFAPDQEKAANELLRVCKPGGTIGLVNWMPEKFGGAFFKTVSTYAPPPPADLKPPIRWGTEDGLQELIGDGVRSITNEVQTSYGYNRSIEEAVDMFCKYFGPIARIVENADAETIQSLRNDLHNVFSEYNEADDGTAKTRLEYLQTIAVRA